MTDFDTVCQRINLTIPMFIITDIKEITLQLNTAVLTP